jgi:hypothetical protein
MSNYTDNLWAEEMGIDLEDLKRESPMHPQQLRNHRRISRQAAEYWANERFLARLGDGREDESMRDGFPTDVDGYQWRTIESLAKQFWVHPNTIRNWVKKGLLPERRKHETMLRVSQQDLDNLVKPVVPKARKKRGKVRNYDFADYELEIALRSLNEKGAM